MTAKERIEAVQAITEFLNLFGSRIPQDQYDELIKKAVVLIKSI